MKRKSIMKGMSLGLAAIMTAGLLAGCGSKETSGGQDTPVQEEQTQEEQSQPASGTEALRGRTKMIRRLQRQAMGLPCRSFPTES